jgi:hypothetical protein
MRVAILPEQQSFEPGKIDTILSSIFGNNQKERWVYFDLRAEIFSLLLSQLLQG